MNSRSIQELVDVEFYSGILDLFNEDCRAPRWLIQKVPSKIISMQEFIREAKESDDLRILRAIALFVCFNRFEFGAFVTRVMERLAKENDTLLLGMVANYPRLPEKSREELQDIMKNSEINSIVSIAIKASYANLTDEEFYYLLCATCSYLRENKNDFLADSMVYEHLCCLGEGREMPELFEALVKYKGKYPKETGKDAGLFYYWGLDFKDIGVWRIEYGNGVTKEFSQTVSELIGNSSEEWCDVEKSVYRGGTFVRNETNFKWALVNKRDVTTTWEIACELGLEEYTVPTLENLKSGRLPGYFSEYKDERYCDWERCGCPECNEYYRARKVVENGEVVDASGYGIDTIGRLVKQYGTKVVSSLEKAKIWFSLNYRYQYRSVFGEDSEIVAASNKYGLEVESYVAVLPGSKNLEGKVIEETESLQYLENATLASQFSGDAQVYVLQHPEYAEILEGYDRGVFGLLAKQPIIPVKGYEDECPAVAALALLYGVDAKGKQIPRWVVRCYKDNEWLMELDGLEKFGPEDLKFLKVTRGYLDKKWKPELKKIEGLVKGLADWQLKDFCEAIEELGIDNPKLKKIIVGYDVKESMYGISGFSFGLLDTVYDAGCIELLEGKSAVDGSLVEDPFFYKKCNFKSFSKLPERVFNLEKAEGGVEYDNNTFEWDTYVGRLTKKVDTEGGLIRAFRELEGFSGCKKEYFSESDWEVAANYNFFWDEFSAQECDLVMSNYLRGNLSENLVNLLKSDYRIGKLIKAEESRGLDEESTVRFKESYYNRFAKLVANSDYKEALVSKMLKYCSNKPITVPFKYFVKEEFPVRNLKFTEALDVALDLETTLDRGLVFLNLLDGNRIVVDGWLCTAVDCKDKTVVVREMKLDGWDGLGLEYNGEIFDEFTEDCFIGLTNAPAQILFKTGTVVRGA